MKDIIEKQLTESALLKMKMAEELSGEIEKAADLLMNSYRQGGKVLLIGNGGSAADAQHIAGELVGYLNPKNARRALPALALTTNSSILTALGNDFGWDTVFKRKVEALANAPHDVLVAITTSGTSPNILEAVKAAKEKGIKVIGLTGKGGGQLKNMADISIIVPSDNTQRIQEAHITVGHIICELIENALVNGTLA